MGDVKSIPVRRALGRVETANSGACGKGDFYFCAEATGERVDGRAVIRKIDTDFFYVVDFELILPATLALCAGIDNRAFNLGKAAGKWIKQHEICQALGVPSPEIKGRDVDE